MAQRPQQQAQKADSTGTNYPVVRTKQAIADVEAYVAKKAQLELVESELKALKPRLEGYLGGAPTAYVGKHVVSVTAVPAVPATDNEVITKEMVGRVIPGRKGRAGYTQLRVQ